MVLLVLCILLLMQQDTTQQEQEKVASLAVRYYYKNSYILYVSYIMAITKIHLSNNFMVSHEIWFVGPY